jgi:hypothetical protein
MKAVSSAARLFMTPLEGPGIQSPLHHGIDAEQNPQWRLPPGKDHGKIVDSLLTAVQADTRNRYL